MSGLRERQKADRNRQILGAAVTLFRQNGFRAVRMEDLAFSADLSVGTRYDYYSHKGDILMGTVALEVEEVLAQGADLASLLPDDEERAVMALVFGYSDHSLDYLSKEMWRAAMALSIEWPETPNGRAYADLDARLAGQVSALLTELQVHGRARADLPADDLGDLVFNALDMLFLDFVRSETDALEASRSRARAQIRPLARMIATA